MGNDIKVLCLSNLRMDCVLSLSIESPVDSFRDGVDWNAFEKNLSSRRHLSMKFNDSCSFEKRSFISLNIDKWFDKDTANEEAKEEIE